MSFTKEKKEKIKRYILEKVDNSQNDIAKRTAEAFGISLNTVYRYIRELEAKKIIKKRDSNNKKYELIKETHTYVNDRRETPDLQEDVIYDLCIKEYIEKLPLNVQKIWQYSFMEMMNNAIDHSESDIILIRVIQDYMNTMILIADQGVGIFRKIRDYYNFPTLDDAVGELFKGKLTTDTQKHSGEGIFFTSRVLDTFAAFSDGKIFTHDKYNEILQDADEVESLSKQKDSRGTIILMSLSNYSKKILREVFDMFSDVDGGFTKTHVPIKNIFDTYPVSRSQAKRLCNRFEKFKEVELDFADVEEIGQGFAHEIFVVFQRNHADIKIVPVNTNLEVEKMINHVKNTEENN